MGAQHKIRVKVLRQRGKSLMKKTLHLNNISRFKQATTTVGPGPVQPPNDTVLTQTVWADPAESIEQSGASTKVQRKELGKMPKAWAGTF